MNKPFTLADVRTSPQASASVHRVDKSREQQNPPVVPPQGVALAIDPVPLEVRRLRVANGSRRQRDLAAVRMAEDLEGLGRMRSPSTTARAAFADLAVRCWYAVPDNTFAIWLSPLRLVGVAGDALLLTAPDAIRTWVERRYLPLIREALQGTGYTDVEFVSTATTLESPQREEAAPTAAPQPQGGSQ